VSMKHVLRALFLHPQFINHQGKARHFQARKVLREYFGLALAGHVSTKRRTSKKTRLKIATKKALYLTIMTKSSPVSPPWS
jgi:hypothetical protein